MGEEEKQRNMPENPCYNGIERGDTMNDLRKKALAYHKKHQGKLYVGTHQSIDTREDMTLAYTPGVAHACKAIETDPETAKPTPSKNG